MEVFKVVCSKENNLVSCAIQVSKWKVDYKPGLESSPSVEGSLLLAFPTSEQAISLHNRLSSWYNLEVWIGQAEGVVELDYLAHSMNRSGFETFWEVFNNGNLASLDPRLVDKVEGKILGVASLTLTQKL